MRMSGVLAVTAVTSVLLASSLACTAFAPSAEDAPAELQAGPETRTEPMAPETELEDIKTRLEAVKATLSESGSYNCCVQPSCNWCALHEGSCACFTNLLEGEPICPGCGLGWHNGQGIVDGVNADDVEWQITHEHSAGGHQH